MADYQASAIHPFVLAEGLKAMTLKRVNIYAQGLPQRELRLIKEYVEDVHKQLLERLDGVEFLSKSMVEELLCSVPEVYYRYLVTASPLQRDIILNDFKERCRG